MGATFAFSLPEERPGGERAYTYVYWLCTATYALSLFHVGLMRLFRTAQSRRRLAYLQLTGDVLIAAALVLLTGGSASAFTFFFSLVIIAGAIMLFRAGGLYLATVSAASLVIIGLFELDVLPSWQALQEYRAAFAPEVDLLSRADRREWFAKVVNALSVNTVAFYGVALLAASLSEKVRKSALEITQQKDAFRELEALYAHVVDSVPGGILTCDAAQKITLANPAATRLLGVETGEALRGRDLLDVFPWLSEAVRRVAAGEVMIRDESILSQGRRRTYIGWTLSPLRGAEGAPIGLNFVFQDISRVRELEHTMRRAEKLAAIGELSAAIAHEVRNPLAAISGCVEMLSKNPATSDRDRRLMDIALRESEQLNRWITDFLSYCRPVPLELRPVDLDALTAEVVEALRTDPRSHGVLISHERCGPIYALGDAPRLRQVLWNLLLNAQQAASPGGEVSVSVSGHSATSRPEVELRVRDTGAGLDPEQADRIFQPFFTTKDKGTGLGLAVVHRIIEDHDGRVAVDSEPGRGATFIVTLPMAIGDLNAWPDDVGRGRASLDAPRTGRMG